jgi:hypothetical protein
MKRTFLFHTFFWCFLLGLAFTTVAQEHSLGRAPNQQVQKTDRQAKTDNESLLTAAYGTNASSNNILTEFDLPAGTEMGTIGTGDPTLVQGADFGPGGLYYGTQNNNTLISIDIATGAFSFVATITGVTSGQSITGVGYDETNNIMYLGSTDITSSELYTLDVATGAATLVGSIGQSGLITIAVDCAGNIYSADLVTDDLWSIDPGTGVGTVIGPLGIDINYCQDADIDPATGVMWFAAYGTAGGQLGTVDLATGLFTVVNPALSGEFCSFAVTGSCGPPCPVGDPSNPSPVNGAIDVDINLPEISWTNGSGATEIEVIFDGTTVYTGVPVTSYSIPAPLDYATTYGWKVNGSNDTCTTFGPNWSFTTMADPLLVIDTVNVYPQNVAYWTGTTDGATKTDDSEVRCWDSEDGWMMFDVSPINDAATITQVTFYGYVNLTDWPYWSATPLPGLNPLTATASELKTAIEANSAQGVAYIYSNEGSGFVPGWYNYLMETWTNADLQATLAQDWFAMGMDSRDNSASYYVNWDGWNENNVPYLEVMYEWIIPVELTSFTASVNENNVTLNWVTATELNNLGFEIQRNSGNDYQTVGFVNGHGTTNEAQEYSFTDVVTPGSYSYRLKQVDFNGTFEYSDVLEVNVDVTVPDVFALEQNYPNPFNPSTKINFSLAVDSKVSLKVFDVLGQEVVTLISSDLVAGSHNVDFSAASLNSGVYFYRIEATGIDGTNFTNVKKMILTK